MNCSDGSGLSPLHKASLNGHRVLVEMLLSHGALINLATNETNMTPLHLACQYNQKDVSVDWGWVGVVMRVWQRVNYGGEGGKGY